MSSVWEHMHLSNSTCLNCSRSQDTANSGAPSRYRHPAPALTACAPELNPEWKWQLERFSLTFMANNKQGIFSGVSLSLVAGILHKIMRVAMAPHLSWIGPVKTVTGRGNRKTVISEPGAWAASCLPLCDEVGGRRQSLHLRLSVFESRNHRNSKNANPNMAWGYIVVRKQSWVMERPRPHNKFGVPGSRHVEWEQDHPPCATEVTIRAALHSPLFYSEVKY